MKGESDGQISPIYTGEGWLLLWPKKLCGDHGQIPGVTPRPNLDECVGHHFGFKIVTLQCNTKGSKNTHSALVFH